MDTFQPVQATWEFVVLINLGNGLRIDDLKRRQSLIASKCI